MDEATQAKLARGARTVEVLKQDLNKPLPVEKQVMIIYALTKGFLDDIPVQDIRRFENEFFSWIDQTKPAVVDHIKETKALPDDEEMAETINSFKKNFIPSETK